MMEVILPFQKEISQDQYQKIQKLFKKTIKNNEANQGARTKGTGVVSEFVSQGVKVAGCILSMQSKQKADLEDYAGKI